MSGVDGGAHFHEQPKAVCNRQFVVVGVEVNGPALDVLHHKIRLPAIARATFEEARNILVIEIREDLLLFSKSADNAFCIESALDYLHGNRLMACLIVTGGKIDGTHPS